MILQPLSRNGESGPIGLLAQHLAELEPELGLAHAVNHLLGEKSSALETPRGRKIVMYQLSVRVNYYN